MYRIWRHPNSEFGIFCSTPNDLRDETVTAATAYSDENLAEIAASGFNGIWIHGQLHHMIHGDGFPEFGRNSEVHLAKMNSLITRAGKHNIKVFLYMQPPRAIPVENEEFWNNHLDVAGESTDQKEDCSEKYIKMRALCTSTLKVRRYLKSALYNLTKALPDLGGYIFISASEYAAHCYSKRNCRPGNVKTMKFKMVPVTCPNCARREPEEVVVELLWTLRDGIRKASGNIPIIYWNWSWSMYVNPPCREIISKLPEDTCLLVGFERGGKKDIHGRPGHFINEYSLSYAGPSEQFLESMRSACGRGLKVMTKLQFGTTHELASVVSLPLLGNVYKKADFIRKNKLLGFMGCWNFGNQQSANTAGFNYFCSNDCPDSEDEALKTFAHSYFPGCDEEGVVKAWRKFDKAMTYFPFCVPFLYFAPTNYALALIPKPGVLNKKSAGRSWLMDERGDDLSAAITDFSLSEIIDNLDSLFKTWQNGVDILRKSLKNVININVDNELGNAEICGATWRSTRNAFKIYELRLEWQDKKLPEYYKIVADELENVKYILPFVARDLRQGFHIEAHDYMFNAEMLKNKIKTIENQFYEIRKQQEKHFL